MPRGDQLRERARPPALPRLREGVDQPRARRVHGEAVNLPAHQAQGNEARLQSADREAGPDQKRPALRPGAADRGCVTAVADRIFAVAPGADQADRAAVRVDRVAVQEGLANANTRTSAGGEIRRCGPTDPADQSGPGDSDAHISAD